MALVVLAIILFAVHDTRMCGPLECKMIDIFDKLPKPFEQLLAADSSVFSSVVNWKKVGGPFPLKKLVSSGKIHIDKAHDVNHLTLQPATYTIGNQIFYTNSELTLNYIGQLDRTVKAVGIGRVWSLKPAFMYEGQFSANG